MFDLKEAAKRVLLPGYRLAQERRQIEKAARAAGMSRSEAKRIAWNHGRKE